MKDGARAVVASELTRPQVGLSASSPQKEAGTRMEPPVSVPKPMSTSPAATATCTAARKADSHVRTYVYV